MKKFASIIFAIFICITSVMLAFSWSPNSKNSASAAKFDESVLAKTDIVGTTSINASMIGDSAQNQSLYDTENNKFFDGYVITPKTTSEFNEVDSFYDISQFSITKNDSIYVWIFIPDRQIFDLTISFNTSNGNKISWTIESVYLEDMLENANKSEFIYGWRLFEFCASNATLSDGLLFDLASASFRTMNISYKNNSNPLVTSYNNKLAFYHVYKASSFSTNTTAIVDSQEYVTYSVNENYIKQGYFINDEFNFLSVRDMFDYLIVGNVNLREYTSNVHSWEISVTDVNSSVVDKAFGEKYVFEEIGYYTVEYKLKETRKESDTSVVLYLNFDVYASYFIIGSFTNVDYKVNKGETKMITFKISPSFVVADNFKVETTDNSIATCTYYVEGSVCYINLTGVSEGEIKIKVSADGGRTAGGEVKNYSCSTAVKILDPNKKSGSEIFLWVILGVYGVGFATFLIISLVKSRKFGVK